MDSDAETNQPITLLHHHKHVLYFLSSLEQKHKKQQLHVQHIQLGITFWSLAGLETLINISSLFSTHPSLESPHTTSPPCQNQHLDLTPSTLRQHLINFIRQCRSSSNGFAYGIGQDPHITSTMYALLSLLILDALDMVEQDALGLARWIQSLQQRDGSFAGDQWGEVDARFSYCALVSLSLLGHLEIIDQNAARRWIQSCQNPDHGFAGTPGEESHAAYTYCCVASLQILGCLDDDVDADLLGAWLAKRQLPPPCGGFNGRPEKAPDVCYSWWISAALILLDRQHWIHQELLKTFILSSQNESTGGIANFPGDNPDVFHTFFGIAALCNLDKKNEIKIHPIYCLPLTLLQRSKLRISLAF